MVRLFISVLLLSCVVTATYGARIKTKSGSEYYGKLVAKNDLVLILKVQRAVVPTDTVYSSIHLKNFKATGIDKTYSIVELKNGTRVSGYIRQGEAGQLFLYDSRVFPDNYPLAAGKVKAILPVGWSKTVLKNDRVINGQILNRTKNGHIIANIVNQSGGFTFQRSEIVELDEQDKYGEDEMADLRHKSFYQFEILSSFVWTQGNLQGIAGNGTGLGGAMEYYSDFSWRYPFVPALRLQAGYVSFERGKGTGAAAITAPFTHAGLVWYYSITPSDRIFAGTTTGLSFETIDPVRGATIDNTTLSLYLLSGYEFTISQVALRLGGSYYYSYDSVNPLTAVGVYFGVAYRP